MGRRTESMIPSLKRRPGGRMSREYRVNDGGPSTAASRRPTPAANPILPFIRSQELQSGIVARVTDVDPASLDGDPAHGTVIGIDLGSLREEVARLCRRRNGHS